MDPNVINGLMKAMKVLECSGGSMDLDQMWNESFPIPGLQEKAKTGREMARSAQLDLCTEVDSSRNELRNILNGLRSLTSSLEEKILSLDVEYKCLFPSHWMNTAPAEILDNIFEEACFGNRQTAWNLCQVNKRFYNIATRNPRLWNRISNLGTERSFGKLIFGLERSKNIGLDIVMNFQHFSFISGVDVLDVASRYASRWENVVYWMCHQEEVEWRELFEEIRGYGVDLDLPRLKSATISFPGEDQFCRGEEDDFIDQSDPLMHFYTGWSAPNLTKLKIYNLFPLPFSRSAPPLTTLELVINERAVNHRNHRLYDMNLLLDFLRSCPLLETLSLTLNHFSSTLTDFSSALPDLVLPDLVLPRLRIFRFIDLFTSPTYLQPFFWALHFPLLRELHVYDTMGSLYAIFLYSCEKYTSVEVLNYKIRIESDHDYYTFIYLFKVFPNLRSLTIDSKHIFQYIDDWSTEVEFPRVEDIHFVGCVNSDHAPLELFRKALEDQDKWNALKEVTFTECNDLDRETVNGIFQGKMVTWNSVQMELDQVQRDLELCYRE